MPAVNSGGALPQAGHVFSSACARAQMRTTPASSDSSSIRTAVMCGKTTLRRIASHTGGIVSIGVAWVRVRLTARLVPARSAARPVASARSYAAGPSSRSGRLGGGVVVDSAGKRLDCGVERLDPAGGAAEERRAPEWSPGEQWSHAFRTLQDECRDEERDDCRQSIALGPGGSFQPSGWPCAFLIASAGGGRMVA